MADVRFYLGKSLQLAGLLTVGLALFAGVTGADARHAMIRELAGAVFGLTLFWLGRVVETR